VSLFIRPVRPGEAGIVLGLVRELAVYEKLEHEMDATEEMIERELFAPHPRVFCDLAEWNGEPVGLALWFYNFSTFRGRCGIYLEDLYVRPELRGKGIGKAFLSRLARRCVEEGLSRFEWAVLDWNTPSIEFYRAMGAELMDGWTTCRVSGEALRKLGAGNIAAESA
jgi:GNAT superfamily N-acetyltransferase